MDHMPRCINALGEQLEETVWVYPNSNVLYRDLMNQIYKVYVEHHFNQMGLGYRPERIMVDDPVLAELIRKDLGDSGTCVEVVVEGTAVCRHVEHLEERKLFSNLFLSPIYTHFSALHFLY